jgi:hypothetical protein
MILRGFLNKYLISSTIKQKLAIGLKAIRQVSHSAEMTSYPSQYFVNIRTSEEPTEQTPQNNEGKGKKGKVVPMLS